MTIEAGPVCRTGPRLAKGRTTRRGMMLVELAAAAVVLVVACALLAQLLFLAARQERAATARQAAWRAAADELELLAAQEWDQLLPAGLQTEPAPPAVRQLLPSAELRMEVKSHENDFIREIRVEIAWQTQAGTEAEPVRLLAWKHRPAPEDEP